MRIQFIVCVLFVLCCLVTVSIADDQVVPSARNILLGIKNAEAAFFLNNTFLINAERVKCEEITPSRYSGGYFNTEFIVAKKGAMWFTSKAFTQIGEKNKDGYNIIKSPDETEVYVPLEPEINILKNRIKFEWNKGNISASVREFTDGGNMHQSTDYFRYIGWDVSSHIVESGGGDYKAAKNEEWLKDYLDHPFLPEFLETNLSKYSVNPVQGDVDGFPCWVVEYPGMDKFWVDSEHGYAIRKRIYHWGPGQARKFAIHNMDFREVKPGIWLPYRQIVDKYASIVSEQKDIWDKVASRLHYEVREILFDEELPETCFEPDLKEGLHILDAVRNIRYTITDPNSAVPFEGSIDQGIKVNQYVKYRAFFIIVGSALIMIAVGLIYRKKKMEA